MHERVEVFGDRTLEVIEEDPEQLRNVKGLGPRKIQELTEACRTGLQVGGAEEDLCRRYPAKKAKGVDGWGPKELLSFPIFVQLQFVAVLRRCHMQLDGKVGL
mgnify:CR=1 FL=1